MCGIDREDVASAVRKCPAPSSTAKVSALRSIQVSTRVDAVYNCRPPALSGPPIQIYHSVFATFIRDSLDTSKELTPDLLDMALKLINSSLEFYKDELARRSALEVLQCWGDIYTTEFRVGSTSIRPDGVLTVKKSIGPRMVFEVVELKNEIGEGGSDPIMQAERSYASIVSSEDVCVFFSPASTPTKGLCIVLSNFQCLMLSSVPSGDRRPKPGRFWGNLKR